MIFRNLVFVLMISEAWCQRGYYNRPSPPVSLHSNYLYWPQFLAQEHIISMTKELTRDTEYKMVRAGLIHDSFKGTLDYEIGFIAAYIQNRFEHMCEVYRKCVGINIRRYVSLDSVLEDNMLVQSDYHEILVMKDLFMEVLKNFEQAAKKEKLIKSLKEIVKHLPSRRRADVMSVWTGQRLNRSDVENFNRAMRSKWRNFTPGFEDDMRNFKI